MKVSDDETTMKVYSGEEFSIELQSNASTGFVWQSDLRDAALGIREGAETRSSLGQVFHFTASRDHVGRVFPIHFHFKRSWEPQPLRSRTIFIEIVS